MSTSIREIVLILNRRVESANGPTGHVTRLGVRVRPLEWPKKKKRASLGQGWTAMHGRELWARCYSSGSVFKVGTVKRELGPTNAAGLGLAVSEQPHNIQTHFVVLLVRERRPRPSASRKLFITNVMQEFSDSVTPGAFLVDLLPICELSIEVFAGSALKAVLGGHEVVTAETREHIRRQDAAAKERGSAGAALLVVNVLAFDDDRIILSHCMPVFLGMDYLRHPAPTGWKDPIKDIINKGTNIKHLNAEREKAGEVLDISSHDWNCQSYRAEWIRVLGGWDEDKNAILGIPSEAPRGPPRTYSRDRAIHRSFKPTAQLRFQQPQHFLEASDSHQGNKGEAPPSDNIVRIAVPGESLFGWSLAVARWTRLCTLRSRMRSLFHHRSVYSEGFDNVTCSSMVLRQLEQGACGRVLLQLGGEIVTAGRGNRPSPPHGSYGGGGSHHEYFGVSANWISYNCLFGLGCSTPTPSRLIGGGGSNPKEREPRGEAKKKEQNGGAHSGREGGRWQP
ncbi:hypothetical protein C8R45DRAFT_921762 [Mycena sanguinolenta]|nr:hypothetical protein C8R45DRAFT_921762 [Mycena sanguinolenta]